jgi:DNA-binding SARP family transcriptional activator/tetratricopeptide (TPR) repeat protein
MLRLRTLGGLTIEDQSGPVAGAIARKRSLALLALVALGTEQGVSRDRVLAFLWPESDTDRARNNLKQTLFQLRQELHEDVFVRGSGPLRLNSEAISVDACDFQAALERGNPTTAATLYQGPFLDGFYLPGLAEFERWVDAERARLAQSYAGALEALAGRAADLGDHHGAAAWWRRLAMTDPLSPRYALGLMRSLAQGGERGAALEHARVYEELVRAELDSSPEPEVTEYVRQLRGMFGRWAGPPPQAPRAPRTSPARGLSPAANGHTVQNGHSGPNGHSARPVAEPDSAPAPAGTPALSTPISMPAPVAQPVSSTSDRGRLTAIGLVLLALALVWWGDRSAGTRPVSPEVVAVFPFSITGVGGPGFLGNGMVDLLSASLDGAGELRSVHPSAYLARMSRQTTAPLEPESARAWARRLGAELYVLGNVVATAGRVQISAALYDQSRPDAIAQSSVEGETAQLFQLVDRLAADLIAGRYGQPHERLTRVAAATTGSLAAFKAYVVGEEAYRAGHYSEAIEALSQAVGIDSTFALGYYRLSDAADRAGRPELAQSAADQALRHRDRLEERERRLIEAQHSWRLGRSEDAERLARSLVADYPDDIEAWLQLAEILVHGNPLRGRSSVEARPALEQVLARDPENGEALIQLARIASIEGKQGEVDSLIRRVRGAVHGSEVVESRAFRAFALGDRPGQKLVTREILAHPGDVPPVTALDVAVMADDLEGSERFGRWLADKSQAPDLQAYGHRMLAQAALARGQWRRAKSELAIAAPRDSVPALELRSLFAAFSFLPLPTSEIVEAREAVRRWDPAGQSPGLVEHTTAHTGLHPYLRLERLALLDLRLGDTTGALREARALERSADSTRAGQVIRTLAQSIQAHVAAVGGRSKEALADLESASWEAAAPSVVAEAYDRYFRGELLARVGREDEALGWFRSIAERAAYELVYLAPSHLRQAEIYDRRGERGEAVKHYRKFIELWKDCDPELRPAVTSAQHRLKEISS